MNYIYRHMENRIMELSQSYSAILLTGPRQAGKTTMLRSLAEKENKGREYVSLDDLSTRDMAKNDPALFLQIHKPPVLIDEVQYAPELFTYIKIHIDEHHNPGDFWMTGSQIFRLMKGVQESLAGRVALLHMSPMSQREIIGADCVPFTTNTGRRSLRGSHRRRSLSCRRKAGRCCCRFSPPGRLPPPGRTPSVLCFPCFVWPIRNALTARPSCRGGWDGGSLPPQGRPKAWRSCSPVPPARPIPMPVSAVAFFSPSPVLPRRTCVPLRPGHGSWLPTPRDGSIFPRSAGARPSRSLPRRAICRGIPHRSVPQSWSAVPTRFGRSACPASPREANFYGSPRGF